MHWLSAWVSLAVLASACSPDEGGSTPTGDTEAGSTSGPPSDPTSGPADTGLDDDSTGDEGPDPTTTTTGPSSECGDGILEGTEECDDGNAIDGDGCNADCTLNLDTSQWQTTVGGGAMVRDSGQGIAVDSLGNIVVGGYVVDAVGDPDMWIAKYDPQGNEQWTVTLDPSMGLDDRIYAVAVDGNDQILLAGNADTAPSSGDVWVGKLAPNGDLQWSTTFDGPDAGNDGGRGVTSDAEGNVLVTGFVRVANNDNDIFLAKLDPGGGTTWQQILAGPNILDDRGQGVVADAEGNAYVAGFVSNDGFDRNVWLRKVDPAGAELWTVQWDSPTHADDAGFGLAIAPDGSLAVAGQTPVIADNQDVWLGRFDGDGELLWWRQFGGQAYVNDQGLAVAADADSNFIVVGYRGMSATDSDIWMRKYDVVGNHLWSQAVAGPGMDRDQATAVATDAELNIVVTGEIRQTMSNDGDLWIGKFGPG